MCLPTDSITRLVLRLNVADGQSIEGAQDALRSRSVQFALTFGAILCSLPSRAAAEPAASVVVEIAEGPCFSSADAAVMQRELQSLELSQAVTVRVQERAGVIELALLSSGALLGTRSIEVDGAACEDQLRAALLAVMVALDDAGLPRAAAHPAPVPSAEDPAPVPSTEVQPIQAPERSSPPAPRTTARDSIEPSAERRALRAGVAAEVGVGVALTAAASMTTSAMIDVAYAPPAELAPEVSGRGGIFASLPNHSSLLERDVWLSLVAARVDGCGGVLHADVRARACGSAMLGGFLGDARGSTFAVVAGGRVEATWRATSSLGVTLGADALFPLAPEDIVLPSTDVWPDQETEDLGPLALAFSLGVVAEWL